MTGSGRARAAPADEPVSACEAKAARYGRRWTMKLELVFALLSLPLACAVKAQDLELSLNPGITSRQRLQTMYLAQVDSTGAVNVLAYPLTIKRGFALSARATLNSHRRFSHEFFYSAMYGDLIAGDRSTTGSGPLRIREAGYSLLFDLTRKNFLVRPFLAVGPTLTSYRYRDIDVGKKGGDPFRFGLRGIGSIKSAFDKAGIAPLNGGTVFRAGLNYGAGLRIRIARHAILRTDYRQTFTVDPDFFTKQSVGLNNLGIFTSQDIGRHRRGVFSIGISYTM